MDVHHFAQTQSGLLPQEGISLKIVDLMQATVMSRQRINDYLTRRLIQPMDRHGKMRLVDEKTLVRLLNEPQQSVGAV